MKTTGWLMTAAVAVLVAAGGAGPACAGDEAIPAAPATTNAVKHQTVCPVEGGEINKTLFADYQGKRVYFCCAACPPAFKKDPAKYVKKLEDAGVTLDKTPLSKP